MKLSYIFDLDGTLFNCDHRLHHVRQKPKNFKKFYASILEDTPIWPTISIAQSLRKAGADIYIVTGREKTEEAFAQTVEQLRRHGVEYDELHMRPLGNYAQDSVVKENVLKDLRSRGFFPWAAFEDRQQVVDMWRRNGVICYQVAEGQF